MCVFHPTSQSQDIEATELCHASIHATGFVSEPTSTQIFIFQTVAGEHTYNDMIFRRWHILNVKEKTHLS